MSVTSHAVSGLAMSARSPVDAYLIGGPLEGARVRLPRFYAQLFVADRSFHAHGVIYRLLLWRHPIPDQWTWCYAHPSWEFAWLATRLRPALPDSVITTVLPRMTSQQIQSGSAAQRADASSFRLRANSSPVRSGCASRPISTQSVQRGRERSAG